MADIAAAVGVSPATVSKVLNDRSDVSPTTRGKVRRALVRHGYHLPDRHQRPGGLIELVFNELGNPWATELIRGAEDTLQAVGLGLVVSAVHGRERLARRWIDALGTRGSLGAILAVSELSPDQETELRAIGVPFVVLQPAMDLGGDAPSVGSTSWQGGYAATQHLIELGHRRIAMITGPPSRLSARARLDGYRAALDHAGLPAHPELVRHGDYTRELAHTHALDLLGLRRPPTAIFAGSDYQALGTYRAAAEHGLGVPGDLSVVGFDDMPLAEWMIPQLTTVRQPLADMAALAARILIGMLNGEQPASARVELATTLVVRESTAPPGDGGPPTDR